MNSRDVTRALRHEALPVLYEAGFPRRSARTLHRHTDDWVDVITIRSAGTHAATFSSCTSHSFAVFLGCHPTYIPSPFSKFYVGKNGLFEPSESACYFRCRLERSFEQPEHDDASGWYVGPNAEWLAECVRDVARALRDEALPWFESLRDPEALLSLLLKQEERLFSLCGFGRPGSPIRCYLTTYVAKHLGRTELAEQHLRECLASLGSEELKSQLRKDFVEPALGDPSHGT